MKTTIKLKNIARFASIVAFSAAALCALGFEETVIQGGSSVYIDDSPIMVHSVYCINSASGLGTNESNATLSMKLTTEYYKNIPWLVDQNGTNQVPNYLDCDFYYGNQYSPWLFLRGKVYKTNLNSDSGDPNLYSGKLVGAYTNGFPMLNEPMSDMCFSNVVAFINIYTDSNNDKIKMECLVTNLIDQALPNVPYNKRYAKLSNQENLGTYIYDYNKYYGDARFVFASTNSPYMTYTLGERKFWENKTETFSIASVATGTNSYAVTNNVNVMVPKGFYLNATTTSPFSKVGIIYE